MALTAFLAGTGESGVDRLRVTLAEIAAAAGLDRPDELADALQLLIDGANARVVVSGDRTAMLRAKAAATRLVKGATE